MSDGTFDDIINYSSENKKVFEELSGLCANKVIVPYIGTGLSAFAGNIEKFKKQGIFSTW